MTTSDRRAEVDALEEAVDFDESGGGEGEDSLGALTAGAETTESTGAGGEILLVLSLELRNEVVDKPVVEVFATQVGVTGGGLDLDDVILNRKEGDVESPPAEVQDEDFALIARSPVELVDDCGSSGLIDDTEDIQTAESTTLPGGLTFGVVEVSGNGNDSVGNDPTKVRLSGLPHLGQDNADNFFG